jgi:hypothetical protein
LWDDLLHIKNIQLYLDELFVSWYLKLSRTLPTGFSNEAKAKEKYRNTPHVAPDLRVQLSNIKPKIK